MRIGRLLPPAAAPLGWRDVCRGGAAMFGSEAALEGIEADFRRALGVRHVFLVSSGTAALVLVLKAMAHASQRRQVVIPAYSCYSVPAAVIAAGLQPVLCDIDQSDYGLDPDRLEAVIGPSTLAVLAHHLFAVPSAIRRVVEICAANGVAVVEDAAQAMGITMNGRWLGTHGDVGTFSFGRGKNVTSGHGGMIATASDRIAAAIDRHVRRLDRLTTLGAMGQLAEAAAMIALIRPSLYWIPSAMPWLELGKTIFPTDIQLARLSGMHAGLLHTWRERLGVSCRARAANVAEWTARLQPLSVAEEPRPHLRYPVMMRDAAECDRLLRVSRARGLGISRGYPAALDAIPQMRPFLDGRDYPAARDVAARLVTLPTHHFVTERDRAAIISCFADIVARESVAA